MNSYLEFLIALVAIMFAAALLGCPSVPHKQDSVSQSRR